MSIVEFVRRRLPTSTIVDLDDDFADEAEAEVAEIRPGHIERNRVAVRQVLKAYAATEARLVDEIAARTEELRQVRVSIDALSKAEAVLEQGAPKLAAE